MKSDAGKDRRIVVVDNGVSLWRVKDNVCIWQISWADVKEIVAWKDDVWAYDIICIGFRIGDAPEYLWCDEENAGWDELSKKLATMAGVEADWWRKVAFPAFAANWTTIWWERVQ